MKQPIGICRGASPLMRAASASVSLSMLAPTLLGSAGLAAPRLTEAVGFRAISAQTSIQTVIVTDFDIKQKSPNGPADLSQWVTDAVAVELASSTRYEVLKRQEVSRAAKELGYRPPFDSSQLGKIATTLGATAIVSGEVVAVKVEEGKNVVKTARVGMRVRVTDSLSGDLMSGAAVIGVSFARPGDSDSSSLIQQAASMAAVQAVKQILSTSIPEGIILNTVGEGTKDLQILVNRGSRDGVSVGMEMVVYRDRQKVGTMRITDVMPTDSEARPIENTLGFRPQDTVRAIFPMPELDAASMTVHGPRPRAGTTLATVGKILLVVLVGVVIATALKGGSSVTGVTAEADIQNSAPAVRVTWRDNLFGGGTLEYHLWRSPGSSYNITGIPVQAITSGQRQTYDLPSPFTMWNGVNSFLQAPVASSSSTTTTAATVTPTAGSGPSGFTVGTTYTYQVSAVLRRTSTSSSTTGSTTTTTQEDIETSTVSSGPATPIVQPTASTPLSGQTSISLSSVTFVWLSSSGADVYQVEVSTDRAFSDKTRVVQLPIAYSTAIGATGAAQALAGIDLTNSTLNAPLRKDTAFANFVNRATGAATPTLWWRVGGRNSADRPGPVHAISRSSSDQDRSFRFIYSPARSFQPAALPPAPP